MADYISKFPAHQIDALLSKVFDSTLQTKDIEITEAGTTEITPDEGFFALKKVNLNVNAQEGGGGDIEYLDVSGLDQSGNIYMMLRTFSDIVKAENSSNGAKSVGVNALASQQLAGLRSVVVSVGISFNRIVKMQEAGQIMELTQMELFSMYGISEDDINSIPRITKEQFYSLEA